MDKHITLIIDETGRDSKPWRAESGLGGAR